MGTTVGVGDDVGVGVGVAGPGPLTVPVRSSTVPLVSANRTVTVAPCSTLPLTEPTQLVWNAPLTGPQANVSTALVVGMKTRGMLPGAVPAGPVALRLTRTDALVLTTPETAPQTVHWLPS